MDAVRFFMFYTVFFLFIAYISGLAGASIFQGTGAFENLALSSGWDVINPFYIIGTLGALFSVSTEFSLLFILILSPFFVGLVMLIARYIRGLD